jgi:hypothetical protein
MLRSLKMYGMAQAVDELAQQGAPAFEAAIPVLSQLLKAETAEREVRSMAYQLRAARFPVYRDLAGFDFSSSEVNEALVRQLHRCDFIEPVDNVVLVGARSITARLVPPLAKDSILLTIRLHLRPRPLDPQFCGSPLAIRAVLGEQPSDGEAPMSVTPPAADFDHAHTPHRRSRC